MAASLENVMTPLDFVSPNDTSFGTIHQAGRARLLYDCSHSELLPSELK